MQPSCDNLGQSLSLLIKKGIFGHPLWEEHGDKKWEETNHKHSSISMPLPQKRSVVSPFLLDWDAQAFLCSCCGRCSCYCLIYTWMETQAVFKLPPWIRIFNCSSEKWRVNRMASPDKDFAQEILIRTELVALPQILSFIDWVVRKWLLCGLLGLLRSMFST